MDKPTDNVFCSATSIVIESPCEVVLLDEKNIELLNSVYKDINDEFGIDVAMRMYQLYKGTQVNFPMRFLNPELVKRKILEEFDGTNLKQLAVKYSYSEKTLRRLIKDSVNKEEFHNGIF